MKKNNALPLGILFLLLLLNSPTVFSQQDWWLEIDKTQRNLHNEKQSLPSSYNLLELDLHALDKQLRKVPKRYSKAAYNKTVLLNFPTPERDCPQTFKVVEVKTMEDGLSVQYPSFKTYLGINVENPVERIRFDRTSLGLHATVLDSTEGTYHIAPYQNYGNGEVNQYLCYFQKNAKEKTGFACDTHEALHHLVKTAEPAADNYKNAIGLA